MLRQLEDRVRQLEAKLRDQEYDMRHSVRSELYQRYRMEMQPQSIPHLFSALCVNTIDPMAEGQVQFYTPYLVRPGTAVKGLPWAYPISPFGGFDDCGVTWVPPAGSKLALFCENGDRNQIYYVGTFYPRTRGKKLKDSDADDPGTPPSEPPSPEENREDVWGCTIPEYDCVWEGTRDGYNLGSNEGDQVKMPWNTDNYQTKDWDTQKDFDKNPNSNKFITYPHQYGFKTPEKHYLKMVDGDHRCNHRWRRLELATGRCNILIMKDDHLHPAGQWAFNGEDPQESTAEDENQNEEGGGDEGGEQEGGDEQVLNNEDMEHCHEGQEENEDCPKATEDTSCERFEDEGQEEDEGEGEEEGDEGEEGEEEEEGDPVVDADDGEDEVEFKNPYYKREEEMRLYKAVPSLAQYGNPKCELPQSGIQMQSVGGQQLVMDDSVDQPEGDPRWNLDFSWGCNDIAKGKIFLRTMTGHVIEMNDEEDDTHLRGKNNGIKLVTATGNRIELRDHTIGEKEEPEKAGEKRGIFIQSTADHVLEFHDEGNEQFGEPRKRGGVPQALSDSAFVLLRSGYGLQLRMDDSTSQQETDAQYVQLLSPQKDNEERGPHQLVMQEQPEGPGLVMMRVGGVYYRMSYDSAIEVVGDEENEEPANKFVQVLGDYIVDSEGYYFNHNDLTIFQAEQYIFLFAGRDCPQPENPEEEAQSANESARKNAQIAAQSNAEGTPNQLPLDKGPCIFPVVVGKDPFVCPFTNFIHYGIMSDPADPTHTKLLHNSLSDRVFASASQEEAAKDEEEGGEGDDF